MGFCINIGDGVRKEERWVGREILCVRILNWGMGLDWSGVDVEDSGKWFYREALEEFVFDG